MKIKSFGSTIGARKCVLVCLLVVAANAVGNTGAEQAQQTEQVEQVEPADQGEQIVQGEPVEMVKEVTQGEAISLVEQSESSAPLELTVQLAEVAEPVAVESQVPGIVITPMKGAKAVVVKTKAQKVGGFFAGMAVGAVLGSSVGTNPQEALDVSRMAGDLTQQLADDLGGSRGAPDNPTTVLRDALALSLQQASRLSQTDTVIQGGHSLTLNQKQWELTYEGMFKDNYQLLYAIDAELRNAKGKKVKTTQCRGTYEQSLPLETWQQDKYALVISAADSIGKSCAAQVEQALGLLI